MPREQINFPRPVEIHSGVCDRENGITEQSTEVHTDPAVHVTWHNVGNDHDGHVQVALECDAQYVVQIPNDDGERKTFYSPILSRSDVNKLIRVLRRARDQAYGRDE